MDQLEADYVIVGGGSAGCVLANRLSENPQTRVVLIEAGDSDRHPLIHIPAAATRLLTHPRLTWGFTTEPEPCLGNRTMAFPRGRVLGGSSAINAMGHVRGDPTDYDRWVQSGCTGWSHEDLLPYFIRGEAHPDGGTGRGRTGELPVVHLADRPKLLDQLRYAAEGLGHPFNPDMNGPQREGVAYFQQTRNGQRRASAAGAFLHPVRSRKNLVVLTDALATRICIRDRRATGVLVRHNGEEITVVAHAEVVLAAGAIGSPHLLLRSGVGPAEQLLRFGIAVVADMPGIGADLQDHFMVRMAWKLSADTWSGNHRVRGWRLPVEACRWLFAKKGALTWSTTMIALFARTNPLEDAPDIQIVAGPLSWGGDKAGFSPSSTKTIGRNPGMTLGLWQGRPESRGSVSLKSPDPMAAPAIAPNYLSAAADCAAVVRGLRLARRWIGAPALQHVVDREMMPGPEIRDDAELLDYARATGTTVYHACGTVRMGSDRAAPLDARLRLRSVSGLRVADASVFPTIPICNINATVLATAEKAADMIREDARRSVRMPKDALDFA